MSSERVVSGRMGLGLISLPDKYLLTLTSFHPFLTTQTATFSGSIANHCSLSYHVGTMTEVLPFRGYRYSREEIPDLNDVVTQPYDKISEQMRQEYLKRHRYNIVRIIKNNDYENAGGKLDRWIQTGILKQEDSPAFYPYEQTFHFEGQSFSRLGFMGVQMI